MAENLLLLFNSIMLGFGLAMDAFSVSLANGFADSRMSQKKRVEIAGTYALFQFAMPVIGFFLVHNASNLFLGFQKFIPWIALILLAVIGSKMLIEGCLDRKAEMKCEGNHDCGKCDIKECRKYGIDPDAGAVSNKVLIMQGIATSIDALSVGFTISKYTYGQVFVSAGIIAVVTYAVCHVGLKLGITFGTRLASYAKIIGGLILIGIGIEVFFS